MPACRPARAWSSRLILTFFLVVVIFGVAVDPKGSFNAVAGLPIGFVIFFDILMGGPLTGAAMNPARWIGPALVDGYWDNAWIYIVGPIAGGVAGGARLRVRDRPGQAAVGGGRAGRGRAQAVLTNHGRAVVTHPPGSRSARTDA